MFGDKLRFRFAKTGTLRLLSHHDLMRCLERMLRRAALPFKSTAGFHPGPRVVFAQSLPLGVVGVDEVVEIEFTQPLDENETFATLRSQAPAGLTFTRVSVVPMKATAMPRRIVYRLELPADRVEAVRERCAELMTEPKVWVERLKPSAKRLNIRPYLRDVRVQPNSPTPFPEKEGGTESAVVFRPSPLGGGAASNTSGEGSSLQLDLWVTGTGTARADELLKLIGVADLVDTGGVIERTTLELRDEITNANPADVPPDGPADTLPLDLATIAALTQKDEEQRTAGWEITPAGPVVE